MKKKISRLSILFIILLAVLLPGVYYCRHEGKPTLAVNSHTYSETHDEAPPAMIPQEPAPQIETDVLLGNISNTHPNLAPVDNVFASRAGMFMHKEALDAFRQMHAAAAAEGIQLTVISAFRNFNHQKRIWENKWNGHQVLSGNIYATSIAEPQQRAHEILRYSAMPGTSRHHWGTDIDINSLNNSYFAGGRGLMEYQWLAENAHHYGFCQPYTSRQESDRGGYEEEKWHWSYMPVSSIYLQAFKTSITYEQITGFKGRETAQELDVIKNYVFAIDNQCLNFSKE